MKEMKESEKDLQAVKKRALARFMSIRGVRGVGIGKGTIRIYLLTEEVKGIPDEFEGVPVEKVISGRIVAASASA